MSTKNYCIMNIRKEKCRMKVKFLYANIFSLIKPFLIVFKDPLLSNCKISCF